MCRIYHLIHSFYMYNGCHTIQLSHHFITLIIPKAWIHTHFQRSTLLMYPISIPSPQLSNALLLLLSRHLCVERVCSSIVSTKWCWNSALSHSPREKSPDHNCNPVLQYYILLRSPQKNLQKFPNLEWAALVIAHRPIDLEISLSPFR